MKCKYGFLTYKDPELKKQQPFFLKVRSKDIVVTTPILIDEHLKKSSGLYTLANTYHGHDFSSYDFTISNDRPDGEYAAPGSAERLYSAKMYGGMNYKLFRDGTVDIFGNISCCVSDHYYNNEGNVPYDTANTYLQFELPYGVLTPNGPVNTVEDNYTHYHNISAFWSMGNNRFTRPVKYIRLLDENPSNRNLAVQYGSSQHKIIASLDGSTLPDEVVYRLHFNIRAHYRVGALPY